MRIINCLIAAGFLALAQSASAATYYMITHTAGTDAFWPVVQTAGEEAAAEVGVELVYQFPEGGDLTAMARLVEAATAQDPAGIIVSLPDADILGPSIKAAVDAGIPVITINSGFAASAALGALMHVGQPASLAGEKGGARAKAAGVTKGICLNQESFNVALEQRCAGYFQALEQDMNMIDVTNDVAEIKSRTAAALLADKDIDGIMAVGPHVCEAAVAAVEEVGATVHIGCFDLTPGVMDAINAGVVDFTVDQQQYLQGYIPVIVLNLYNKYAGMLPGASIPSGPGFVTKENAASVKALVGKYR